MASASVNLPLPPKPSMKNSGTIGINRFLQDPYVTKMSLRESIVIESYLPKTAVKRKKATSSEDNSPTSPFTFHVNGRPSGGIASAVEIADEAKQHLSLTCELPVLSAGATSLDSA